MSYYQKKSQTTEVCAIGSRELKDTPLPKSQFSPHKIISCSTKQQYPELNSPDQPFAFMSFIMSLSPDPKPTFINFRHFSLSIAPLMIRIQEDSLDYFVNTIYKEIATIGGEEKTAAQEEGITFNIDFLIISPLKFKFTYKTCINSNKSVNILIKSLAAAFIQLQEIPVEFEQIELMDIYAKLKALGFILISQYTTFLFCQQSLLLIFQKQAIFTTMQKPENLIRFFYAGIDIMGQEDRY